MDAHQEAEDIVARAWRRHGWQEVGPAVQRVAAQEERRQDRKAELRWRLLVQLLWRQT